MTPLRIAATLCLCLLLAAPLRAELVVEDDTGRHVQLAQPAHRIISLAPHVTELLFAAGAGERVVGVVDYSDFPDAAKALPRVGSYSNVDMEAIAALRPDLVIAWRSGNRDAHLDKLAALGIPVFLNEPRTLDDVARSLETFGRLAGSEQAGHDAAELFRARRTELARRYAKRPPVPLFYQIWDDPLMTINDEHLISDVIRLCGGRNVFGALAQLAPAIGVESVLAADPEAIVASGMGDARPEWLDRWKRWPGLAASRAGNLYFVPPELIQRHTPRILDGAAQLCEFLDAARAKRDGR
ncbi:probable substrate-binding periplasmic (PBP) ABC transporter protein [Aromatoleum aromaticum EbN1]|uniref:Probable substrate-binding periplasmic (PBP) ABC transporter protein n=1 Tax=Aromatoleum aromaticum (strain DSM 19018 / LMG 30748 / EbN1) TaxID=76114 RepID=Q5P3B1_AROAE|nr:cobalamin-binding protein [Aromatoleum aromaticum]CAI08203.1 probable substrate-binding periplasmic (PBP) ABC transporter protein [Aromatoleum aromaticum EbN1]